MKCTKHRKDGKPCGGNAVDGTDACKTHAGRPLAQQKAKGAINLALRKFGVDDIPEDPGLLALKLMTVTEWRRQDYEDDILRIVAESGAASLSDALVGDTVIVDSKGIPQKVGEYILGIVQLEQQERKMAADLALKVMAARVDERMTRAREQVVELSSMVLRAVLADFGHDLTDPAVLQVVSARVRELVIA